MLTDTKTAQYCKVLGNWSISRKIGDGTSGQTAVYQIIRRSSNWEESCALKAIPLIREKGVYSYLTEARRKEYCEALSLRKEKAIKEVQYMSALRGKTNIVDYIDYDTVEWAESDSFGCDLLIRMELLQDLRSELRKGRVFSEKEIIRIGQDICCALVACHDKNILHRDIKPENIFFNDDGDYKLGDFGIAKILDENPNSGSTGVGTPEYAAPEQNSGRYDMRVDLYSLGLVLYELSNQNRLPFAHSAYITDEEVRFRLLGKPLPMPSGDVSSSLVKVILKACAFNPSERYQSAKELLNALREIKEISEKKPTHQSKNTPHKRKQAEPSVRYETVPAKPDYYEIHGPAESKETIEKQALAGNASAQYRLAVMYYTGDGVSKDHATAVQWLYKAALQEHPAACIDLGNCYKHGIGVKKNESQAFNCYKIAASHNIAEGFLALADCYFDGVGTEKNADKAVLYYQKAAQLGSGSAFKKLGDNYYEGKVGEKNVEKALDNYLQAIKKQHVGAARKYKHILKHLSKENIHILKQKGHQIDNIGAELEKKVRKLCTYNLLKQFWTYICVIAGGLSIGYLYGTSNSILLCIIASIIPGFVHAPLHLKLRYFISRMEDPLTSISKVDTGDFVEHIINWFLMFFLGIAIFYLLNTIFHFGF